MSHLKKEKIVHNLLNMEENKLIYLGIGFGRQLHIRDTATRNTRGYEASERLFASQNGIQSIKRFSRPQKIQFQVLFYIQIHVYQFTFFHERKKVNDVRFQIKLHVLTFFHLLTLALFS